MKTGVVLELRGSSAVILDGSGGFRTVHADSDWRPGDVVPLAAPRCRRPWAAGLAACLTAAVLGSGYVWFDQTAVVSLDVNPSVELGLNRLERVVSVTARNDEGQALLADSTVKGLPVDRAVEELLGSGYLSPYLEQNGYVTLSVQSDSGALAGRLNAAAVTAVGTEYQVECHQVDSATLEAAHHYGVTAGKYLALLELQQADPALDIRDYLHCGIGEIREETEHCRQWGHNFIGEGTPNLEDGSATPSGEGGCSSGRSGGHHRQEHCGE